MVVDLPDPVAPTIRINPRFSMTRSPRISGSSSVLSTGMLPRMKSARRSKSRGALAGDAKVADMRDAEGGVHLHRGFECFSLIRRHQFDGNLLDHCRVHYLLIDGTVLPWILMWIGDAGGDERSDALLGHQVEKFVQDHAISASYTQKNEKCKDQS